MKVLITYYESEHQNQMEHYLRNANLLLQLKCIVKSTNNPFLQQQGRLFTLYKLTKNDYNKE